MLTSTLAVLSAAPYPAEKEMRNAVIKSFSLTHQTQNLSVVKKWHSKKYTSGDATAKETDLVQWGSGVHL